MRNRFERQVSRREFVAQLAAGAGVALVGCSHSGEPSAPLPPTPADSGLDHVIVVTMENRSFDHLLGWVPGADGKQAGLSYVDRDGTSKQTFHLNDFQGCGLIGPIHSFEGGREEYHDGACDGWLTAGQNDIFAIGYYVAADLPFLGRAAPVWTVLDRYFSPFLGPTYPNRLISQAGQTDRLFNASVPSTLPAIWDRLSAAGLSGRNYGDTVTTASLWGSRFTSLIRPMSAFFSDAASGSLPNVAFVDPDFLKEPSNSYHPYGDIRDGEAFIAAVYGAVTRSPAWSSTLLIVTFDEWGGFFDHVRPPVAPLSAGERAAGNHDGLRGFRVPTVLISPFARRGAVSSVVYDHASILRLIEWRWSLEPLSVRDTQANNLADDLDFEHPQLSAPVIDVPGGPFGHPCG